MSSPFAEKIMRENPGWMLASEFAKKVGRHKDRVRDWRQTGLLLPSREVPSGERVIPLYNEEDVKRAKQLVKIIGRGGARSPEQIDRLEQWYDDEQRRNAEAQKEAKAQSRKRR